MQRCLRDTVARFRGGIPRSHKPTSDECEAGRPQSAARLFYSETATSSKEVKPTSSVVLKTVLPHHFGQTGLLSQSPLRERFRFLPNSPGRSVPQSPSSSCEKEPDPCLPILATVPRASGQGI